MHEGPSSENAAERGEKHLPISSVSKADIHLLAEIRRSIDGEKNSSPAEKFAQELARYEGGWSHRAFLIRDGEKIIGYIEVDLREDHVPSGADPETCTELRDYAHVARIGLLPEYRGRRIGNQLLSHAEIWARAGGATAIWLDFLPEKEPLVQFYETAGYRTFTEFKDGERERMRRIVVKQLI